MKITTRAVFDIATMDLLQWEGFAYEGEVALCGGGPSQQQKDAATAEAQATRANTQTQSDMLAMDKEQYAKINPYATQRLNGGLPFYGNMQDYAGGPSAQAYAPANAAVMRNYGAMGSAAPSGSMQQTLANVGASRANAFDQNIVGNQLTNEQARNNAAAMLTGQQQLSNPLGWSGAVTQGNSSIMNAPLASQGLAGLFGGMAQGAVSKIPF